MHASAAESLLPYLNPGNRVLDVGSGSGYLTAVLAELVSPAETPGTSTVGGVKEGARVVGLEHIKALRDLGEGNLGKGERGRQLLERGLVEFVVGDGRKGWKEGCGDVEKVGWDAIHVGAAASELHGELVEQLRRPGR
jgi:protein-L-isoaspartate(D-aspartate) O-methyltransferase